MCGRLRRATSNPIIVLTADGAEDRKIDALDAGADDYVTKPFSLPELLARVRVALRHRRRTSSSVTRRADDRRRCALLIDVDAHLALLDGRRLDLTPKEFALLTLLARNAGRVLTHRAHPRPGVGAGPDAATPCAPTSAAPAQARQKARSTPDS